MGPHSRTVFVDQLIDMGFMPKKPGVTKDYRVISPWPRCHLSRAVIARGEGRDSQGILRFLPREKPMKFPATPQSTQAGKKVVLIEGIILYQ